MKQKITIRVHARCDKCRTDALKVAAEECGVTSVALSGDEKVVVIGEKVNAAKLTKRLDKKIGHAWIETVEEVKPKKEEEKKPPPCPPCCNCGRCRPPCPPGCNCGRCRPPCPPGCSCERCRPPCGPCKPPCRPPCGPCKPPCRPPCGGCRPPPPPPCPSSCRCGRCQGPDTCNNNCNLM